MQNVGPTSIPECRVRVFNWNLLEIWKITHFAVYDPMEMEKENDGDEYVLLSPNFVMSGGPTKKPSLIEYFTK